MSEPLNYATTKPTFEELIAAYKQVQDVAAYLRVEKAWEKGCTCIALDVARASAFGRVLRGHPSRAIFDRAVLALGARLGLSEQDGPIQALPPGKRLDVCLDTGLWPRGLYFALSHTLRARRVCEPGRPEFRSEFADRIDMPPEDIFDPYRMGAAVQQMVAKLEAFAAYTKAYPFWDGTDNVVQ